MLVLTRKADEEILIGDDIKITLVRVRGNSVRIGIEAPRNVRIVRGELEVKNALNQSESDVELEDVDQVFAHPQREPATPEQRRTPHSRIGHLMDDPGEVKAVTTDRSIFVGRIHRGDRDTTASPLGRFMSPR